MVYKFLFALLYIYTKTRTLPIGTPASMLSGDLRVALALLWYALFIKIIRDWGCQSHFMFFFHVFGPKNSEISRIFYTDILGMPETWPKMLQKPGFSVSHDKI